MSSPGPNVRGMAEGGPSLRTYQSLAGAMTDAMTRRNRPSVKTWTLELQRSTRQATEYVRRGLASATRRRLMVFPFADAPAIMLVRIGSLEVFVDTTSKRLWQVHTAERTAPVEDVLKRWVSRDRDLEFMSLPEEFLNRAAGTGAFVGFGLHHSEAFLASEPDSGEVLSVRVNSAQSEGALGDLRDRPTFANTGALSMVKVRQPLVGLGAMRHGHITSTLNAGGRVSSRGDSFERHKLFVDAVTHDYQAMVQAVEAKGTVGSLGERGEGLRGPLVMQLGRPIEDLEAYCSRAFAGGEPFFIWGLLERRSDDYIIASCFERRASVPFTVEATPDRWFVYLPDGTPGGVAMRLWQRLQVHHDRRTTLSLFDA